jgi:Biotin-lipoyl like
MCKRPSAIKLLTMIAVLAVAAGGAVAVARTSAFRSAPAPQAPAAPPTVPVVAASVQSHDVPIYLRGVGTVIAYNNVLVRSQITGQLVKISFHQGQTVKKGDVLAVIDPSPYQAHSIRPLPVATAIRRISRTPRSISIVTPCSRGKTRSPISSSTHRKRSSTSSRR